MKKLMSLYLVICVNASIQVANVCCGACTGGCDFWCIEYEKDCNGHIESYISIHVYDTGDQPYFDISTSNSNPGWIGMDIGKLDASCDNGPCI